MARRVSRLKKVKMASQSGKKELLGDGLLNIHPEGSEEEVDKEWEEFTRLMAKLKEKGTNRPHRYRKKSRRNDFVQ